MCFTQPLCCHTSLSRQPSLQIRFAGHLGAATSVPPASAVLSSSSGDQARSLALETTRFLSPAGIWLRSASLSWWWDSISSARLSAGGPREGGEPSRSLWGRTQAPVVPVQGRAGLLMLGLALRVLGSHAWWWSKGGPRWVSTRCGGWSEGPRGKQEAEWFKGVLLFRPGSNPGSATLKR